MKNNPQYLQQYSIQSLEWDYKHYYFIIRGGEYIYCNGRLEVYLDVMYNVIGFGICRLSEMEKEMIENL